MGLSDNFTLRGLKCRSDGKHYRRSTENDDSEACDNIFQTGHLMSRNLLKLKFHSKDFKMLLTCYAQIDQPENGE